MPFLQFLNGGRDQEYEALNENASLVVGSGGEAHIRVGDDGIAPKHATVYPAQGSFWLQDMGAGNTIFKMQRMASTTQGLQPGDVFIVGTTYIKFWQEKPAGAGDGGGGGGGADPAALEAAQQEAAAANAEAEKAKTQAEQAESSLKETQTQLEQAQQELESAKQQVTQLESDLSAAKSEAEAAASAAKEEAERERAEVESALEASRTALEAIQAEQQAGGADPIDAMLAPSDLSAALDALELPDPIRARLDQAVAAEIDREVLRRSAGPVVPLRGFRIPGSDRDLEQEILAIRRRGEQVAAAREHGLGDLEAGDLERLLEMARS